MLVELYKVYSKENREIGNIALMNEFEYFCKNGKIGEQVKAIYLEFRLYNYQSSTYRLKETFFKRKQSKHDTKEVNNLIGYLTEYYLRGKGRYIVGSERYALDLKIICENIRKNNKR